MAISLGIPPASLQLHCTCTVNMRSVVQEMKFIESLKQSNHWTDTDTDTVYKHVHLQCRYTQKCYTSN